MKKDELLIIFLFIILLFLFCIIVCKNRTKDVFGAGNILVGKTIAIDAGHGGRDPGALGRNGKHERELNLEIALKLQQMLEQAGAYVIMTRSDEKGLYLETTKNKKREDMNNRKNIINKNYADIGISIHQNTFRDPKYKGAQIFYQRGNQEGENLAKEIRVEIKKTLDSSNKRVERPNSSYYILKRTKIPMIMIECGFISNYNEEKNLNSDEYQNKLVWVIYKGIISYYINKY